MNDQASNVANPASAAATPVAAAPWPQPARSWYTVGMFGLMVMIAFMNQGVIGLLVEAIKKGLKLTDTEVSFIIGFAAASVSSLVGLPISRLVDRMSRKVLIGIGLSVASVLTACCGLAQTFWQLFFARMGTGISVVGNGPAAFSILADTFPPAKLPKALAIMNIGFAYARSLSLIVGGGVLIPFAAGLTGIVIPVIGTLQMWQWVFLFIALPEVFLALLVFTTLHEPQRRGVRAVGQKAVPVGDVFRFLWDNRAAFGPMFAGLGIMSLAMGTLVWSAPFFQRTYGWGPAQYGVFAGVLTAVVSPIGLIGGGLFAEWLARKGYNDANLRTVAIATTAYIPFGLAYPLMPTPTLALVVQVVGGAVTLAGSGPQNAALQVILPNEMRGQVTAAFLLVFSLIAGGIAPTLVALLTNYVFHADAMLRYSMLTVSAVLLPIAALVFWRGLPAYGRAFAQARTWH
jgi:MFS family permease